MELSRILTVQALCVFSWIAFEGINPDKAAIFTEHCLFIYFILFWTIFSQGCSVQRGWFEWGPDEKKNNTRNDDR